MINPFNELCWHKRHTVVFQYFLVIAFFFGFLTFFSWTESQNIWQASRVLGVYSVSEVLIYSHAQLASFVFLYNAQFVSICGLNLWLMLALVVYLTSFYVLRRTFSELRLNTWLLLLFFLNPVVYHYIVWPFYTGVSFLGISVFVYGSILSFKRKKFSLLVVIGLSIFALFNLKLNFITVLLFAVPVFLFRIRMGATIRSVLVLIAIVSLPSLTQVVKNRIVFGKTIISSWAKFNVGRASCENDVAGFSNLQSLNEGCLLDCKYKDIHWLHDFFWNHHRIIDISETVDIGSCFDLKFKLKQSILACMSILLYDPLDYDMAITNQPTLNLYNPIPVYFDWDTTTCRLESPIVSQNGNMSVGRVNIVGLLLFLGAFFLLVFSWSFKDWTWFLLVVMGLNLCFIIMVDGQEGQRMLLPYYPIIWLIFGLAFKRLHLYGGKLTVS